MKRGQWLCSRMTLVWCMVGLLVLPMLAQSAPKERKKQVDKTRTQVLKLIPRKLIEQVYPPQDTLSQTFPRLFMTRADRQAADRARETFYRQRYGLISQKKTKPRKPKKPVVRHVTGIVRDASGRVLVSIDGRFHTLRQLTGGRAVRIISHASDRLVIQVGGKRRVIEVGRPLPSL